MKKTQKTTPYALRFTHAFASLGYLFVLLLWAWVFLMFSYQFMTDDNSPILPAHSSTAQTVQPIGFSLPEPLVVMLSVAITVAVIILSIYLIITLPRNVAKSGSKIIQKTATATIPIITKHQKISEKKRLVLGVRLVAGLKAFACILPVLLMTILPIQAPLDTFVAQIIALFCSIVAATSFLVQYTLARLCKVSLKLLW